MTSPTSPADELRAAAQLVRACLAEATPGPWTVNDPGYATAIYGAADVAVIAGGRWGGEASVFDCEGDAAWIALMHPGVGEPIAKWLEAAADDFDWCQRMNDRPAGALGRTAVFPAGTATIALTVARALLGTAQ